MMGKIYFIKKEFQTKFIIKFCLIVILSALISGVILYFSTNKSVGNTYLESLNIIKLLNDTLIINLLYTGLITIIVISIVTIALTLFASHKIAGPLYRLEKNAEVIGNGDLTLETRLRENDEVTGVAEALNKMTQGLRSNMIDIRNNLDDVKRVSEEAGQLIKNKKISEREINKLFARLSNKIKNLNNSASRFTVK
ncbi:MAG: methyl-accepting chemotaxis protein [Nitrospirae bacterium]|nr:methyl-accepting chemotaxis protein [Nitrospirota bacterium]